MLPESALLMKLEWADKILNHGKSIELRSKSTTKRGRIALASGGKLLGEVTIKDCYVIAENDPEKGIFMQDVPPHSFQGLAARHQVHESSILCNYKKVWAWELEDPLTYGIPREYFHPRGAQMWVSLIPRPPQLKDCHSKARPKPKALPVQFSNSKRPATALRRRT